MADDDNKAQHGSDFKKQVLGVLLELKAAGIINSVAMEKNIAANSLGKSQFYAPFYIETENRKYIIFSTTSARSDRIKINQWDANGIKAAMVSPLFCYLVLPSQLTTIEEAHYKKEAARIAEVGYVSALDGIIKIDQLEEYIK